MPAAASPMAATRSARCIWWTGSPPTGSAIISVWGGRVIGGAPKAILPHINERSLYQFEWGFREQGRSLDDFLGWAKQELRPVMRRMMALCEEKDILKPQAAYGYWKA